jgi:plasmid stabilization system protein ParE
VAEIVYSGRALENLEHAFGFLSEQNPGVGAAAADAIISAVEALAAHPLLGRRVEGDLRELVISYGATGYIALYRYVVSLDQARVLALRHQREIGYLP